MTQESSGAATDLELLGAELGAEIGVTDVAPPEDSWREDTADDH